MNVNKQWPIGLLTDIEDEADGMPPSSQETTEHKPKGSTEPFRGSFSSFLERTRNDQEN